MQGSRSVVAILGALSASLLFAGAAAASDSVVLVHPTGGDFAVAKSITNQYLHAKPAAHVGATALRDRLVLRPAGAAAPTPTTNVFPTGPRYPTDLTYHGGAVVTSMVSHPIFLDASGALPLSTWGDPVTFLHDLGRSNFIHLVDEFVGATRNNRYTVTAPVGSTVPGGSLLVDADVVALVHAVAASTGETGYGHQYHVFLAPGVDECFDTTYKTCYSPDKPASFVFCAYHGSVDFPDIGHVLYSVEPYQNVPGCQVLPGTPNGLLVDSTNSVLSHEVFETITDPDGDAWWNSTSNSLYGAENGDTCSFVFGDATEAGFNPSLWTVGGKTYATQPELSNRLHRCQSSIGDN